jgi:hypothetical protein
LSDGRLASRPNQWDKDLRSCISDYLRENTAAADNFAIIDSPFAQKIFDLDYNVKNKSQV